ncbi:type I-E CRISPR-associated protein Cse2/CasB [Rhodovulum steppense]|nr:type I-E CRISPR-associated protein Cse2/CasB [Rhodovulum steppense]
MARNAVAIAAALAAADSGEKAEARRMDEGGAPIFWRQVARLKLPRWQEAGWLRFTRMVAILTPASAGQTIHDPKRPVGAVLADGGSPLADLRPPNRPFVSEQRLARLLAARGDARRDALERAIRMLARNHPSMNVVDLARLNYGRDRNELARAYYQRIDFAPTEESQDA